MRFCFGEMMGIQRIDAFKLFLVIFFQCGLNGVQQLQSQIPRVQMSLCDGSMGK